MRFLSKVPGIVALMAFAATPLSAEVVRIEVQSRSDLVGGQPFGAAGPYEKIAGEDLLRRRSRRCRRTASSPTSTRRRATPPARSSSPPTSSSSSRRTSRAATAPCSTRCRIAAARGCSASSTTRPGSVDPELAGGDGRRLPDAAGLHAALGRLAVRRAEAPGLVRVYPPIASDNGRPIRGLVRSDFVVTEKEADHSLADRDHTAYAVVDPDSPDNVLTVRDSVEGPRRIVPREPVGVRPPTARRSPIRRASTWPRSSSRARSTRSSTPRENPPLVGLGPAAIRDVISMLKYESADALSIPAGAISARYGVRHLAERPLPAHLPLLRLQPRRGQPQGVRRRHRAGRRRRPRQLQPPLRAAVARRPSVHQLLLSDRHLSRSPTSRSGIPRPA